MGPGILVVRAERCAPVPMSLLWFYELKCFCHRSVLRAVQFCDAAVSSLVGHEHMALLCGRLTEIRTGLLAVYAGMQIPQRHFAAALFQVFTNDYLSASCPIMFS